MNILKEINNKLKGAEGRIREEIIYAAVMKEIKSGSKREGLWAKALSGSEGNKSKAESLYIKYRVQSIEDELQVEEEKLEAKEAKKTEARNRNERDRQNRIKSEQERIDSEKWQQLGFFEKWMPHILVYGSYVAVYFYWDDFSYYLVEIKDKIIFDIYNISFIEFIIEAFFSFLILIPFWVFLFFQYWLVGKLFLYKDPGEHRPDFAIGAGVPLLLSLIFILGSFIDWLIN
jgi:hypothetical protein